MKKLIIACEIIILFICFVKTAVVLETVKRSDVVDYFLSVDQASAKPSAVTNKKLSDHSTHKETIPQEKELISSLLKKEKQLKDREISLNSEKVRLNSLKNEILSKFTKIHELEEKLSGRFEQIKKIHDERYKKLAKLYESTPPAQASAMLEKLDKKTAAAIIMNMRTNKAGAIWGYMDPGKGVEITKEITNIGCLSKKTK